jgi:GH15 family glucan-1,4-alpha-glucosidase
MEANLDLAVIGNCTWGGLIDRRARLVWACMPRFDSDPIFPALLDEAPDHDGTFSIDLIDFADCEQHYDGHTAILVTVLRDHAGNALEIRDFAPRFVNHGRTYRPTMLVRRLRPIRGDPRIRVILRPRCGYGSQRPSLSRGSNHVRIVTPDVALRLTTDVPIAYVTGAVPFVLEKPLDLILGPDESLAGSVSATARDHEERTRVHWTEWARTLSIPFEWQDAVLRSAISLKLCHFEETGAIVAALTTSLPEAPNSGRNWDYRFCWLRDAYFVIHALNRLGATTMMEGFLSYIQNLAAGADGHLQPVYGIDLNGDLEERVVNSLAGYRGMGPVRVGNQAYTQPQHDVYGSLVLAATHSFFDQRLLHGGGMRLFELLEGFGTRAERLWDQPDAGLWELRTRSHVHTFSAAMCWAACDRLAKIALRLDATSHAARWRAAADRIRGGTEERAWSEKRRSFVSTFGGEDLDASLLLLHEIGFIDAEDPRFVATVEAIEGELLRDSYLQRYAGPDDFGQPSVTFNICTFWYIGALTAIGRRDEARALFENMLARRNRLGLLSEDLDPASGELWGNFPQTYSMVGLIIAATRLSKGWEDAF